MIKKKKEGGGGAQSVKVYINMIKKVEEREEVLSRSRYT